MKIFTVFILALLISCATTEVSDPDDTFEVPDDKNVKEVPPIILGDETGGVNAKAALGFNMAVAPLGTLRVSKVTRPRAEMREGPGIMFALADRILEEGDKVVVFEQYGVWAKVMTIGHWEAGWLHAHTLSAPRLNKESMTVNFAKFPTVLAVKPIERAVAFGGQDQNIAVAIPKGKIFKALQITEEKTLIWMPEKNSMVWIKGKDMQ